MALFHHTMALEAGITSNLDQTMEGPHGVQVVSVEDDHTYHLNEGELQKILMKESIKDLPVAMVSVAGAYRGGKSFVLNFFIRYLSSSPSARADGSWLGDENLDLTGFTWHGGSTRVTTGILMWSEPFVVTLTSGEKVAVLLMDTQGTFDSVSSVKDCSTIFALSSLLSSMQIYNLRSIINENDLQNLQLFTNYGQLIKNESGKAFQVLEFLIRDWMNPWEYDYGLAGGEEYLKITLKTNSSQNREVRQIREKIKDSFEKVTCFLMPHPGYGIADPKFKGTVKEISPKFINKLKELATSIFGPENLCIKKIGGHPVKSSEMLNYFKSYMTIMSSDTTPTPTSILQATADAGLLLATQQIRDQFEQNMERSCGAEAPSMPASEVIELHRQELVTARNTFAAKKLMGDRDNINKKLEELIEELTQRQTEYIEKNRLKTLKAIENGNEAYKNKIETVTKGKPLCLNPLDLLEIHNDAMSAAIKAFDENRKTGSDGQDSDRDKYSKDLTEKYEGLKLTNEQNNRSLVAELKTEYMEYIMGQANTPTNQCEDSFEGKHEIAKADAINQFRARRNKPSPNETDVYESNLILAISNFYVQAKEINDNKNLGVFKKALMYFNSICMKAKQITSDSCCHPKNLKDRHERTKKETFNHIRPLQVCSLNMTLLLNEMENHYNELEMINESANNSLVNRAYWVYREKFNDNSSHWYYAFESWNTIRGYHNDAFRSAVRYFYNRRKKTYGFDSDDYYDEYYEDLRLKCEHFWDTV